jgi:3,4-dihydroxy 2-butanone 4-phosphate synthase/GTP cyclohydrolase II
LVLFASAGLQPMINPKRSLSFTLLRSKIGTPAILTHSMKRKSSAKKNQRVRVVAEASLPTSFGDFRIFGIEGKPGEEAVAILRGKIGGKKAPMVRVHSQCLTGDVFTSQRCDCRAQLEFSLRKIAKEPAGVLLYLPQEGRGIGLINKLKAYQLQDAGLDTVEANRQLGFADDARDYEFAAEALKALGVGSLRLLSNNPDKVAQLEQSGIRVVERVPCRPRTSHHSKSYLKTKQEKMGHLLPDL